jgi:hypothetical protein
MTTMLLINKTIQEYGYDPVLLSSGSSRRVWASCPQCKTQRSTTYRQLSLTWTCPNCARKKGHKALIKWTKNENFFSIPNHLNSYVGGFIAGDGSLNPKTKTISILLKRTDRNHLEKICSIVNFTGPIIDGERYDKIRDTKTYYSDLRIYNGSKWIEDLAKFNITPNKTLTLLPPENLNIEESVCYLCGLIDSDGSIYTGNSSYLSILGTEKLSLWCQSLIGNVSSHKGFNNITDMGNIFEYRTGIQKAIDILKIVKPFNLPLMERKWSKIRER